MKMGVPLLLSSIMFLSACNSIPLNHRADTVPAASSGYCRGLWTKEVQIQEASDPNIVTTGPYGYFASEVLMQTYYPNNDNRAMPSSTVVCFKNGQPLNGDAHSYNTASRYVILGCNPSVAIFDIPSMAIDMSISGYGSDVNLRPKVPVEGTFLSARYLTTQPNGESCRISSSEVFLEYSVRKQGAVWRYIYKGSFSETHGWILRHSPQYDRIKLQG
jgi:hypothetical protein